MITKEKLLAKTKYRELAEEIKDIITEHVFQSRWILLEGHWLVGKRIREECKNEKISEVTAGLAVESGVGERTLWYCIKFYDKYPDMSRLPEGKSISWNKLVTKYLTDGKEKSVGDKIERTLECPMCHFTGKESQFV